MIDNFNFGISDCQLLFIISKMNKRINNESNDGINALNLNSTMSALS